MPLGVVPILVNVGAALLPAIVAGVSSAAALLFRPRELARAVRQNPVRALIVLLVLSAAGVGTWAGVKYWPAPEDPTKTAPKPGTVEAIDWSRVAVQFLRFEELHALGGHDGATRATRPAEAVIYRQNASRSGYAGGKSPTELMDLWSHREEPGAMHLSSPAVAGEWVYAASCVLDPPSNYGSAFCLNAKTGKVRWTKDYPKDPATGKEVELKGFFSSPAVTADGKYVVFGQGLHVDRDCSLLCFDAETGDLKWRVKTSLHLESSPAIHGDMVVIGAGAVEDEHMKPIGDPGFVLAVQISTGEVLWRHAVNDPESSPAIGADGTVYVGAGFNGSAVIALRPETDEQLKAKGQKRELWSSPTPFPAVGAITLTKNEVIMGCGNGNYVYADPNPAGAVLAFDRQTGKKLWEVRFPDAVLGAVAVRDDVAICGVRNGEVVALDLEKVRAGKTDEQVLWRVRVSERTPILSSPAFTGEFVYALSADGYLGVIRASDGKLIEKHYTNDEAKPGEMGLTVSSPTVANGRIYVGTETGGLRCLAGRKLQ